MVRKSYLSDRPENLIRKFNQALTKQGYPVEKIILFGSYAKGTEKPWSDVDICVVSNKFGKKPHDEMIELMHVASGIEPLIEPHPYNPKDLNDPWDPLAVEIKRYGKVIV